MENDTVPSQTPTMQPGKAEQCQGLLLRASFHPSLPSTAEETGFGSFASKEGFEGSRMGPSWDQVLPLTHLVKPHEDIGELNPVQKRQRETLI